MENFLIVYPEKRLVSEKDISLMYFDAVANNEVDEVDVDADNVYGMALALDDAGIITLSDPRFVSSCAQEDDDYRHMADMDHFATGHSMYGEE